MGEDRDARNLDVIKAPKAELLTVKPMEEGRGASIWDALKVQRVGQSTA